jgi:hypothetical protein
LILADIGDVLDHSVVVVEELSRHDLHPFDRAVSIRTVINF